MHKFLLAAAAGIAIVSSGALVSTTANAAPLRAPLGVTDDLNVVDQVRLCFYVDGWNGPGLYECGFRARRGMGWHGRRDGFRDGNRGRSGMHNGGGRGRSGMHNGGGRGGNPGMKGKH